MLKKVIFIVLIVLTLAWLGFIFSNSLDDAAQSSQKSSSVSEVVNKVAEKVGIEEEIPESTVRDMAHFSEFALLAVLLCADAAAALLIWGGGISLYWRSMCVFCSLPVCFILACVDELLQKLSDGRAAEFSDVLLDTLGATCGVAAGLGAYLLIALILARRARRTR